MMIRHASLYGRVVDIRIVGGHISEIGEDLPPAAVEDVIEARGGALLPGLHDHHIHLNATAAALASVQCGPPTVRTPDALAAVLGAAPGRGWIRGIGYHESVAGEIDRTWLDRVIPSRPIRMQHRSGRLWMLNSAAATILGGDTPADGRLLDRDDWLRSRLHMPAPDLRPVGVELARHGVTGLTETTARNGLADYHCYASARLPQRLRVMGNQSLNGAAPLELAEVGEVKLHFHDHDLPALDDLVALVVQAHTGARGVAVHCVTAAELMLALAAFEDAGSCRGDRIEHGGIIAPEFVEKIAALGLTVVAQPHFLMERGEAYRVDVPAEEHGWLYRLRSLARAGIPIAAGSDAPFGSLNPWRSMAAAVDRPEGFGANEALTPERALALYTGSPRAPGGPSRQIAIGQSADLCLLDRSWSEARANLADVQVRATWVSGTLVYGSDSLSIDSERLPIAR